MLGSMHAVRITHLQHHRDCLGPDDVEGQTARRSALRAIGAGLAFPIRLHHAAWRRASRTDRRFIAGELLLTALFLAFAATRASAQVTHHVALMVIAQGLTGFFAVWTVHHDVDEERQVARTMRHRIKSALALGMFFHLEHHLFPAGADVPSAGARRSPRRGRARTVEGDGILSDGGGSGCLLRSHWPGFPGLDGSERCGERQA